VQDLKAMPELLHTDLDGLALPGDKAVRAARWSHLAEDGRVCLVDGPWVKTFLDEAEVFGQDDDPKGGAPQGSKINDDFMDATSGVVGMLEGGARSWLDLLAQGFSK
jgi:phage terminase large subunit-like protein